METEKAFCKIKHEFWFFKNTSKIGGYIHNNKIFYMKTRVNIIPSGEVLKAFPTKSSQDRTRAFSKHLWTLSVLETKEAGLVGGAETIIILDMIINP